MTIPTDEHERTMAFAEIALGQIRALRQPASPRHFEIWYTYATGYNPSLNQMINEMLSRNGTLRDADIEQIYETYLSPSRYTDRIDRVGSKVMDEIEQVMAMIGAAAGTASDYTQNLANASQTLGLDTDDKAVRSIVESLVTATAEMQQNNQSLEARLSASKQEIDQLQENLETVRTESLTDPLTTLANRKSFDDAIVRAIADAQASNEPMSLMLTDIDHFKKFNDTFGHLTGDQVLRLVAISVKQNVKGQDIAARYGGEEFAVVLPNTVLRAAITVADHIRLRGHGQGIDEALDRRASRPRDHFDRRRHAAARRYAADPDRARRPLPLCRQAQRPQPGGRRKRSGGRQSGAAQGRLSDQRGRRFFPFLAGAFLARFALAALRLCPRCLGFLRRRTLARLRLLRHRQGGARPDRKLVGIVVEPVRHAPVGRHDTLARALRERERRKPLTLEYGGIAFAGLEIDDAVRNQAEHRVVGIDAGAAEHAAHRDRAEDGKQLDDVVGRHEIRAGGADSAAGLSCTDSPQPQAEVWFGLLKTNCADSLSVL